MGRRFAWARGLNLEDAPRKVTGVGIGRFDLGMQPVAAAPIEIRRLNKSGTNFLRRQLAGRDNVGIYCGDQKKPVFRIRDRVAGDFVPCPGEASFLIKRYGIVEDALVAKLVENKASELLLGVHNVWSNAAPAAYPAKGPEKLPQQMAVAPYWIFAQAAPPVP